LIARGQKNKNNNLPWSLNMLIFPFPSLFVKSRKKERKKEKIKKKQNDFPKESTFVVHNV